jgi:hypothetical protein
VVVLDCPRVSNVEGAVSPAGEARLTVRVESVWRELSHLPLQWRRRVWSRGGGIRSEARLEVRFCSASITCSNHSLSAPTLTYTCSCTQRLSLSKPMVVHRPCGRRGCTAVPG